MFFSVKAKNSNWDKMGLRIKNFKKWHLKRGGGVGQFADLREGGLGKKEGGGRGVFLRGWV